MHFSFTLFALAASVFADRSDSDDDSRSNLPRSYTSISSYQVLRPLDLLKSDDGTFAVGIDSLGRFNSYQIDNGNLVVLNSFETGSTSPVLSVLPTKDGRLQINTGSGPLFFGTPITDCPRPSWDLIVAPSLELVTDGRCGYGLALDMNPDLDPLALSGASITPCSPGGFCRKLQ